MHKAQMQVQELLNRLVAEDKECGLQVLSTSTGCWSSMPGPSLLTWRCSCLCGRPNAASDLFSYEGHSRDRDTSARRTLQTRICDCWPEFGARGKRQITLRQCPLTARCSTIRGDSTDANGYRLGQPQRVLKGSSVWTWHLRSSGRAKSLRSSGHLAADRRGSQFVALMRMAMRKQG